MAPEVIQVNGLHLSYGQRAALQGVSLSVPEGAVLGLVGRNGAGKSSLLRCLVGLSLPQAGSSRLWGQASHALDDCARARLGYVSQGGDLVPWLTVWQHLEHIGSFYTRWRAEQARALCQRMALNTDDVVGQLSAGNQQKLALVLALAHDPDLLVLDEPVSGLDPLARRDFMRLLFDDALRQRPGAATPRTVVLSSHLLTDLERVVSHVAFLSEGRILLQGPWDDVQEQRACSLEDLFVELQS